MRTYPKLKVAAVQASSVYMDVQASVDKACRLIKEAADKGAKLIGFPESYLPGFPYWCYLDDPVTVMPFTQMLFTTAISCPGPELGQIAQCAKQNSIYVCIGATEREGGSVYDTQFMFDDNGNLLGKHRKLKPMNSEKMIWGEGDASTMEVYETPFGNMGSLISCDHMNPMLSMIMCSQVEEVHVASFPTMPKASSWYRSYDVNYALANCYAISNACFVIFSTDVITQEMINILTEGHPEYISCLPTYKSNGLGGGNACIIDPDGVVISDKLNEDEEGIVTADLDLAMIGVVNFFGDTTGHYCNPAVHLEVDITPRKIVNVSGTPTDYSIPYDTIKEFLKGGTD